MALAAGGIVHAAPEDDWAAIENAFRTTPLKARRLTGPLFWLHGDESEALLRAYVAKVAEGGNGCFTAESRPHNDWLGEGWFRDLAICLDAAKEHGLHMWIFDEEWWPSGEVGGRVPEAYASKRIRLHTEHVRGPDTRAFNSVPDRFVACIAGRPRKDGIDGASLVDLTATVQAGETWTVPAGPWELLTFTWDLAPARAGHFLVDGASQEAVDWYLKTVYQPHYDRFPEDFGKTIRGFFYDEPETYGDWGTEVIPFMQRRGEDWMRALVAWKRRLADPEEQRAARYMYRWALAEAWGQTLYGGITAWCRDHGVKSIGHFLEHRLCYLDGHCCAGDMVQLQKYSDMGGIDAVFDQFVMGRREARDAPCWQTPKLGSSITHAYGKPDDIAMVEIYGARGQDLTYPEMKWWADHMHVSGINFFIPHSFNPRGPHDTDCPPYFYNNGFEPRWPLYRVFADYTARLSQLLTGGAHVCPVALLYLGQSAHEGRAVPPDAMSAVLQDALYDCDWLPYDVFETDTAVNGKNLVLRDERYRVLIVPPVETIPYPVLAKAKAFFDAGGIVVGYGFTPVYPADLGHSAADIQALATALWGNAAPGSARCATSPAGGRSYLLPETPSPELVRKVLAGDAGVPGTLEVLEGDTGHWLHVLHRRKAGRDLFFICNQNHTGPARDFRFRFHATGVPECWDPLRNTITALPFERSAPDQVICNVQLEPLESMVVLFAPAAVDRPPRIGPNSTPLDAPVAVLRLPYTPQTPELPAEEDELLPLTECAWMWYPEGQPASDAPPGVRYLRTTVVLPDDAAVEQARFRITGDNRFVLYVNGQEAAKGQNWAQTLLTGIDKLLEPGANCLAVEAENGGEGPNPAGVIGHYEIRLASGVVVEGAIDASWKTAQEAPEGWRTAGFDDSAWPAARVAAPFGAGPWGRLDAKLTLPPCTAEPFLGRFSAPEAWCAADRRVCIEAEGLRPEEAAAVTVNGAYAGGFIGKPLRLDITAHLRSGENHVLLEPFAPEKLRVVCYPAS